MIKLYEDDQATPVIVENQPDEVSSDVVRSTEAEVYDLKIEAGRSKKLKGFFSTVNDDTPKERAPIIIDREAGGIVLENEPEVRSDVIRGTDMSETDKQIQIEAGRTHSMKNMWQVKYDEEADPDRYKKAPKKQPIKLDVAAEGPVVLENQPIVRDDVVRGDPQDEVVQVKRGHIKNMAGAFIEKEEERPVGPKEMIKIDRSEGPSVIENQPEEYSGDVVRGSTDTRIEVSSGLAKNMVSQWTKKQQEDTSITSSGQAKPRWVAEIENAKENAGVYENEPEVREDLLKEDIDPLEHQSIIPEAKARNMKALWAAKMEEEEQKNKPLEVISRKKKAPPPPPPPKPKPEPKKKGRRGGAPAPVSKVVSPYGVALKNTKVSKKNEKEESPPPMEVGPPKTKLGGGHGRNFKTQPMSLHSAPVLVSDNATGVKFGLKSSKASSRMLRK